MGLKFKKTKIKVKINNGRGAGEQLYDGVMQDFLGHYESIKEEFDGCSEEEKAEFVQALNDNCDGLGDAFIEDKDMFEGTCMDVTNHENFFKALEPFGLKFVE